MFFRVDIIIFEIKANLQGANTYIRLIDICILRNISFNYLQSSLKSLVSVVVFVSAQFSCDSRFDRF